MKKKVTGKQPNSKMCFVCGLKNTMGLRAGFYELESGELLALFTPGNEHQGYPARLHGGVAAAILDETIGRAIMISSHGEVWGVTVEFSMRLKKPVPLGGEIRVVGRIDKDGGRIFEGTGEILLPDGTVAVEGRGKYIKMPIEKIADFNRDEQEWRVTPTPGDPVDADL